MESGPLFNGRLRQDELKRTRTAVVEFALTFPSLP